MRVKSFVLVPADQSQMPKRTHVFCRPQGSIVFRRFLSDVLPVGGYKSITGPSARTPSDTDWWVPFPLLTMFDLTNTMQPNVGDYRLTLSRRHHCNVFFCIFRTDADGNPPIHPPPCCPLQPTGRPTILSNTTCKQFTRR